MKQLFLLIGLAFMTASYSQINLNSVANKTKKTLKNNKKKNTNSSEEKKEGTNNQNGSQTNSNTTNNTNQSGETADNNSQGTNDLAQKAAFYDQMNKFIDRNLPNTAYRKWDNDFLNYLDQFNIERLEAQMKEDEAVCGVFLQLYPKKLPTSGMGTITQNNLSEYSFARVADANAEPPAGEDGKKIMKFYITYCEFRHELITNKNMLINNLKRSIQDAESAHARQKFKLAKLAKRSGEMAARLLPDDMRIADLRDEAVRTYQSTVSGFGNMLCSDFHKTHLTEIVVFGKEPSFANEGEADLIQTIVPGEPAYITGYFATTNKTAGGIPSILLISPENKYAKDIYPWGHGNEVIAPMFNGESVRNEYLDKAYFTFNVFPDPDQINYKSHVQYIPHLNFVKWLRYLPSEIVEIPVRFGRNEEMALGKIKVDLTGDNKQKLEDYAKRLEAKRLAAVTFPDFAGCSEKGNTVRNKADLDKYGKVLKLTLVQGGDIMKPWPNDHEIDYHTASGFAAVQKPSGKVEIMPLDFRKKPGESTWQWWSVGSWPDLYSIDEQGSKVTAVKKIEHGYEILPENVQKCGYWYTKR